MKWWRKSMGPLTFEHFGHTHHSGLGFKMGDGGDVQYTAFAISKRNTAKIYFRFITSISIKTSKNEFNLKTWQLWNGIS